MYESRTPAAEVATPKDRLSVRPRLDSVDMLRGLVMVIMALDHVRDYFTNAHFDPTDLTRTSVALFLTRWVTHFCAPVFVFLAGTGAYLSRSHGKPKTELARFLLTRGLWLVFLELTVLHVAWFFNFDFHLSLALVIWAIGWSMVVLAGLVFLPTWVVTLFGVSMIALHNLFDGVRPESLGSFRWLWVALHNLGFIKLSAGSLLVIGYPLVPWVGVIAAGYGFGALLVRKPEERQTLLVRLGLGLVLAFVLIRATNRYGDAQQWSVQKNALLTIFSFINCSKYPPSLLFLLMTLGPAILMLSLFDRPPGRIARPFVVYGRVPLFYYLIHIFVIHGLAVLVAYARYGHAEWFFKNPQSAFPFDPPNGYGYNLLVVYVIWLAVVLSLFPACRWFADLKRRRRDAWLNYL